MSTYKIGCMFRCSGKSIILILVIGLKTTSVLTKKLIWLNFKFTLSSTQNKLFIIEFIIGDFLYIKHETNIFKKRLRLDSNQGLWYWAPTVYHGATRSIFSLTPIKLIFWQFCNLRTRWNILMRHVHCDKRKGAQW